MKCSARTIVLPPPPHFCLKASVVLVFAGTGCGQLDRFCENGLFDTLFEGTFVLAFLLGFAIGKVFYILQYRKLKKWREDKSGHAPWTFGIRSWSVPVVFFILPLIFVGLFAFADCSVTQQISHYGGILLGWVTGCIIAWVIFHCRSKKIYTINVKEKKK